MPFHLSENTLQLRARAYELLAITHEQVSAAPQITPSLAMIERTMKRGGQLGEPRRRLAAIPVPYGPGSDIKTAWPFYLSMSDHADARKVNYLFNSLPKNLRRACPIEAFCVAASVSPAAILDILVRAVTTASARAASIIAAANQPRVMQKNIEQALTDDGLGDRTLYAKITGLLPTPRGAQTIVSVQTSANASAAAVAPPVIVPSPEQTTRRLANKLNEMRGLPAAPTTIDMAPVPMREMIPVDAARDSDDDDADADD